MAIRHVQDIERALVIPPTDNEALQEFIRTFITKLSQQVQLIESSFEAREIDVTGGAGNVAILWTTPAAAATYIVTALPSWSTTVYWSARGVAGITLNFGTVAPGAQTVLVCRVR